MAKKRPFQLTKESGSGATPSATVGQLTSNIKNKAVRSELYEQLRRKAKKKKKTIRTKRQQAREAAEKQGLEPPPVLVPKTIENTREKDETIVLAGDEEVYAEEADDEFAAHFLRERPPKVLITTSYKPTKIMFQFLSEMMELFPYAEFYKRNGFPLKKIVEFANKREYTDIVVFNEDRKTINGLTLVHLPEGPTAQFKLSSLVLGRDIKNHGRASKHKPELVLNNFDTRLGRRMGRMFASLFSQDPNFKGRRVVTFHNQRDFIFVRHHRYIFEEKEKKQKTADGPKKSIQARLQELGPRFTLKLLSLQKGTFDSKCGEYEWLPKDTEWNRRKFNL